jgi:hypothetical protein
MGILALLSSLIYPAPAKAQTPTFSDTFSQGKLDTSKWTVMDYASPGRYGQYTADTLDFSQGMLRIKVQKTNGGGIYSKELFGYGTFTFVMRMSTTSATPDGAGKTLSGAVSSGFIYLTKSETEVDLEFLGNENAIHITTWHNAQAAFREPQASDRTTNSVKNKFLGTQFREYRLVWTPKMVQVYIDGVLVTSHRSSVPSAPAHIILQHRAVDTNTWGGTATKDDKYFFVKSVTYTPMETK